MTNFVSKMGLIIWKGFIMTERRWIVTVFEICFSISIFLCLSGLKLIIPEFGKQFVNETKYHPVEKKVTMFKILYFTPNNTHTMKIIKKVVESAKFPCDGCEYRGFKSEESMMTYISHEIDIMNRTNMVAVVFNNVLDSLPKKLSYRIRVVMPQSILNRLFSTLPPYQADEYMNYFLKRFISIQWAIDVAYIQLQKPTLSFKISYQQMPYPAHWESLSLNAMLFSDLLPNLTSVAFIGIYAGVLQRILAEKASGIKELMKMMGLKVWMLWLGWYLYTLISILISTVVIIVILKVPLQSSRIPIFEHSDGLLLWVFFFFYSTSGLCFCFMVSTFFKEPVLGTNMGIILWMLTIIPVMLIRDKHNVSSLARNLILIFPNTCLFYGFSTICAFEDSNEGMQWSNLFMTPSAHNPFYSIGKILFMLFVDSLIFLILTWYIDSVHPGDYGIRKSWTFPIEKRYWCSQPEQPSDSGDYTDSRDEIEPAPTNLQAGIKIRNLYKIFNKKNAVNGLNIDIYNDQITVLLGHNGAGKTTTISIITGMISSTSGSVLVNGYNVQTNMDEVRDSLALCPQHNVQFPDLTVLEHLMFFAMLKGKQKQKAKEESLLLLQKLDMYADRNREVKTLSGGMQRRLSLGIALVGNSKLLMLDEPTTGMDPEARRKIWDILLSMRGERTILITTHYMEEADILGDRIAIMHNGQLLCYGTSLFLKKHYGTGYTMSVTLSRKEDINMITNAIKNYVPNVKLKTVFVGSAKFELPTSNTSVLSKLFSNLEKKKGELGIASINVSITTMDDVFLKVEKLATDNEEEPSEYSEILPLNEDSHDVSSKNTGLILLMQQFCALWIKRIQYIRRNWFTFLVAVLLPLVFELLTIFFYRNMTGGNKNVTREINLGAYPKAQSFYDCSEDVKNVGIFYAKAVEEQLSVAIQTDEVHESILKVAKTDQYKYHISLITAAEFRLSDGHMLLNAMFSKYAIHSPAISLNLIMNALIKYAMQDDTYSISLGNNPIPIDIPLEYISGLYWLVIYLTGLTFFMAFLLTFHVEERLSGIKHLQIMSGVSRMTYWLNNYFFDMFIYVLVVIVCVIIIIFLDKSLSTNNALHMFTVLVILFGLAAFPFSYFFHYRPTVESSITYSIMFKIIAGTIFPILIIMWETILRDKEKQLRECTTYTLMFCPHFLISYGFYKLADRAGAIYVWDFMPEHKKQMACSSLTKHVCCEPTSQKCKDFYNYYAGEKSLSLTVWFLIAETFIYFALFLFTDYGLLRKYFDKLIDIVRTVTPKSQDNNLDSDVIKENIRVTAQINDSKKLPSNSDYSDVLLVSNLRKWFGIISFLHAVKGLNFGVKESECFGLLGINGAGKTTTFKMLIGEIFVSAGYAKILQYSLIKNKNRYLKQIGYCPQFNAFNLSLSTRQMLTFFARIRGIHRHRIKYYVNKWLNTFDLIKHQHIQCANLSGGNKRKLSTAIALIGDPLVIMLDEPTSGVDPVARRNLWSILNVLKKTGQIIVLTSHSMDECEAMCDRIAIMVDGQMKCIGEIQYLKNKFAQGFTVMVKMKPATNVQDQSFETQVNQLKSIIENKYVCTLKDEHKCMVMYHITDVKVNLSEIFVFMENLKQTKEIVEDFAVADTSLEQVFLSFANEKHNKQSSSNNA